MTEINEEKQCNEDMVAMLESNKNPKIIVSDVQERVKSVSLTSLPSYINGESFSSRKGVFHQWLVALSLAVLMAGTGNIIGYTGVATEQLYHENSSMKIDIETASWIASVHSLATPIGSIVAGPLMEKIGRRSTLQTAIAPLVIGWIIITTSSTIPVLIVGRIFCGFSSGVISPTCQVYAGEIAEPRLRGSITGSPSVAYSFGILLIYILGATVTWRMSAALSIILPSIALLALSLAPESPIWLAKKEKIVKATASISYLRGSKILAQKELGQLISALEEDKQNTERASFWTHIKHLPVLKPFLIAITFNVLQTLSGTYMIIFYAVDIIKMAAGSDVNSAIVANISAAVRLVITIISSIVIHYINRRELAIASAIGSSVSTMALGVYLWCTFNQEKTSTNLWVTVVCLTVFVIVNTAGFMMLGPILVSELLPTKVRGICSSYIFVVFNLSIFGTIKLYPLMQSTLGSHGIFISLSIVSLLSVGLIYIFLPETRNKNLLQIEKYFEESHYTWIGRNK